MALSTVPMEDLGKQKALSWENQWKQQALSWIALSTVRVEWGQKFRQKELDYILDIYVYELDEEST